MTSRIFVAPVLIVGLLNLAIPVRAVTTVNRPTPTDLKLRSESQVRTEADWYNTAIREITRASSLDLKQPQNLKTANSIFEKHVPNLRYNRSKLVSLGLSDSSFISAVRAKVRDKITAEQLAVDLVKDPTLIFRVSGGQSLADRVRRSLEADATKLRQISTQLQQASLDIKETTKNHHASRTVKANSTLESHPTTGSLLVPELTAVDIAVIVVVVAVIAVPPLGFALLHTANAIAGVTLLAAAIVATAELVVAAGVLIGRLISNLGTEEGQDKIAACQRQVDTQYRRCMRAAAGMGIFRGAAELACYAEWLVSSGACLVTP